LDKGSSGQLASCQLVCQLYVRCSILS
jgi:hypothetical protein